MTVSSSDNWRRWRLVLGETADPREPRRSAPAEALADPQDREIDRLLSQLYDGDRAGGLAPSTPQLIDWLGDIRRYFPASISRLVQRDALARTDLRTVLADPRLFEVVEADVALLPEIISLAATLPESTRQMAHEMVRRIVNQTADRLRLPVEQAVHRHFARQPARRPRRAAEIDWPRTIRANLRHYQPDYQTIIPVRSHARPARQLHRAPRTITICVDLSRSMAGSTVHSTIIAALLARIPALRTHLVAFDTTVVDLTSQLADPVDLLLGLNLGGGTDIRRALDYCRQLNSDTPDGVIFLISDLRDHSAPETLLEGFRQLHAAGQRVVPILALSDEDGEIEPSPLATSLATLGLQALVATPAQFPDLLATALTTTFTTTFTTGLDLAHQPLIDR